MLARVAETLYWTARDLERAAATVRALEVSHANSLEGTLQNGAGRSAVWEPVLRVVGDPADFMRLHRRADERSVSWYLTMSEANPDSVVACLGRARERVRAIRSVLPTEVFEAIGDAHINATAWTPERLAREGVFAFCHQVRRDVAVVDGVVDRAVRRDENWWFMRTGSFLERAIQVARLLSVHAGLSATGDTGGLGDWRTVLRLAMAYESYVRVALPGRERPSPAAFLLLDPDLPSSIAHCLGQVGNALDELRALNVVPAEAATKAAVFAAFRSATSAAQAPATGVGLERLLIRLGDIHEAVGTLFLLDAEFASGPLYAQAVRQAQN